MSGFGWSKDCDAKIGPCGCGATHVPRTPATHLAAEERTREIVEWLETEALSCWPRLELAKRIKEKFLPKEKP